MNPDNEIAKARQLWAAGQIDAADQRLRKVAGKYPGSVDARYFLGTLLAEEGRYTEGIRWLSMAERLAPSSPWIKINLGTALQLSGDGSAAVTVFERVLALGERSPELLNNLGTLYTQLGWHDKAINLLAELTRECPEFAVGHNAYGRALAAVGEVRKAFAACSRAVELAPANQRLISNRLMISNYVEDFSAVDIRDLHRQAMPEAQARTTGKDKRSKHPLTLGFISPDFGEHSVSFFIRPLLEHLDQNDFRIFLYSNKRRNDETEQTFRRIGHSWKDISQQSDEQVVSTVSGDQVDVLVDLAGHTSGNRHAVFAMRAAPTQVSFLGYPSTTGILSMDIALTDSGLDPSGAESHYVEQLERLKLFCVYSPPAAAPEVSRSPFVETGVITFGVFHSASKWSPENLERWARLLAAHPASKILMMANGAADACLSEIVSRAFERHGVAMARVEMRNFASMGVFLSALQEVDLCLDASPWSGHTVSCHALWMGVPTLTIEGGRRASRMGSALMREVGLDSLVARDEAHQSEILRCKLEEKNWWQEMRGTLRQKMRNSRLLDGAAFATDFANRLRSVVDKSQ